MSEPLPCRECGNAATRNYGTFGCVTKGCSISEFVKFAPLSVWNALNQTTIPDWARIRDIAKEKPETGKPVIAYSKTDERWWSMGSGISMARAEWTHWHYPAPIPKEPSKFERFRDHMDQSVKKTGQLDPEDLFNKACDILGKPEEKTKQ